MTEFTEVPSPFCGIGTDDLTIQVDGLSLKVVENGCDINTPAFEQEISDTSPRISGLETDFGGAIKKAAEILRETLQPVYGGCATDVNGMRALMSLADRNGAVVDHMSFSASRRNFLAMQDSGWMNTTLAEIKNRCDVLLVIGTELETFASRFYERYINNPEAMFIADTAQRKVINLGSIPTTEEGTASPQEMQNYQCEQEDLPQVVAVLRALVKGQDVSELNVGDLFVEDLRRITSELTQANYGVIMWAAKDLDFAQAELTVQSICELVKDINHAGVRCSGFPLGGKQGDQTANQVCGWQTGYPARVRFSSAYPEYDPFLYDSQVMLQNQEADALLWVQAYDTEAIPPQTDIPTIVLGRSGMRFQHEPDVFIPVGTPGIDHAGHAYRLDNVVAIRLQKIRESGLPCTAEVLTAIEQAL